MSAYKSILRPLFFLIPPEPIHHFVVGTLKIARHLPGIKALMRAVFKSKTSLPPREVFGIRFNNPIGIAAGFDKNAEVYNMLGSMGFGFVEVGTVTPKPQPGNTKPRIFRLSADGALVNRMGFNNGGLENMIRNLRKKDPGLVIGVNMGKNTLTPNEDAAGDYLKLFRNLYEYGDYFVVNVSCPNVKDIRSLQNKKSLTDILDKLFEFRRGQNVYRPLLVKVSPDLDREYLDDIIDILIETPLDGLVAVNTTSHRDGLKSDPKLIDKAGHGGLSGKPLTDRALDFISHIHERTEGRYPIIGVGGVFSSQDAKAMLDAGASLVQVYTGFIYEGPGIAKKINKELVGQI